MRSKPSRHWYKWQVKDYLTDTQLLSDGADLLYRRLLDQYWLHKKLPNNVATLRKLCRYSARKMSRFWPEIESKFLQKGDYLIHPVMEGLLAEAVDKSQKSKHAANIRWACERNANAYAPAMPRMREEIEIEIDIDKPPLTSPPTKKRQNGTASPDGDGLIRFEQFWERYPRKVGKKKCAQTWRSRKLDKHVDSIIEALNQHIEIEWQDRDKDKIPHPSTWLNQDRWEDEVTASKPNGNGNQKYPTKAMTEKWTQCWNQCHGGCGAAWDNYKDESSSCHWCNKFKRQRDGIEVPRNDMAVSLGALIKQAEGKVK